MCCFFLIELMISLTKGKNVIKNLAGSSYLIEIDKLSNNYKKVITIVDNNHQVENLYNELKSIFSNKNIIKFPNYGISDYENCHLENTVIKDRFRTLMALQKDFEKNQIIITTFKSVFYKIPQINDIQSSWKEISLQSRYKDIINILREYKYTKVTKVESPGQYRITGSIIDFFSIVSNNPIRINFFNDGIETIKEFNINTQLSNSSIEKTIIASKYLYHLTKDNIYNYKKYITRIFDEEYKDDLEYERIVNDMDYSCIHNLIPCLYKKTYSILSSLNEEFVCFSKKDILDEYSDQYEMIASLYEYESKNRYIVEPDNLIISKKDLSSIVKNNYFYISTDYEADNGAISANYSSLPSVSINYNYKEPFTNLIQLFKDSTYKFIFFIDRDDKFRTLIDFFNKNNISFSSSDIISNKVNKVEVLRCDINQGFIDNENKRVYVCANDLFGLIKTRIAKNESIKSVFINKLTDLKIGEYIVHAEHGIGRYKGLITMSVEQKKIELIKIEYADNNNLYIPITSISLIQKFIGHTGINTKLASLGSDRWLKIKQRAKKKIEDIAAEILRVQAQRELRKGYKYKLDTYKYEKFCNLFPYVETNDQMNSINDVIDDMCSTKPMDRLICGDVGFGKTEVILRAAFLAVSNNKQVIVIVPTTVLAKQHFETFSKRFNNYNYNIDFISRVLSQKDKNEKVDYIKNGKIDIIIGTHSLLNKSIKYKDLGLLIIDEEHKFGVKHKEMIKSLKENIEVLSLTATPIPRTLNSALAEIKDLSIINTPPVGRKDIETRIIHRNKNDVEKYITREINRGGQILFIHNDIKSMQDEINFLKDINPKYKIQKVHGQLPNKEIETVMSAFINEEIEILICTSIIESGLDLTNVNTIIINNAQNFGLSQLHQIRGRVGRSNRQAYAGLIICDPNKITTDAEKRLEAFIKTDSLAGGLDIAGHDLEIRGAGEILGEEQSGQIFEIGYAMYTSLLSRAINQIKNKNATKNVNHIDIDAYISTLIPQDYIEDIFIRLEFYNDISNAVNEYELNQIISKLIDIYGPIPEYLDNLLNLTKVRIYASHINAEKIKINKENTVITLNDDSIIDNDKLIKDYVMKEKIKIENKDNLKIKNSEDKSFNEICNDTIQIVKSISI